MIYEIHTITLQVSDQEGALRFYTEKLGFEKRVDMPMGNDGLRWLTVAPKGENTEIVLAKGFGQKLAAPLGSATGWVFHTDDIEAAYKDLISKGVRFTEIPTPQSWGGIQAQFEDEDANEFVLVQMPKR